MYEGNLYLFIVVNSKAVGIFLSMPPLKFREKDARYILGKLRTNSSSTCWKG